MKKTSLALIITMLGLFLRIYLAYYGPIEYDEPLYVANVAEYNLAMRQGDWDKILHSTTMIESPQFFKLIYSAGLMAVNPILDTSSIVSGKELHSIPYWPKIFSLRMISVFFGTVLVFLISLINPVAGLFLAINTYAIKYTSVIYLEALPALTSFIALMAALKSLEAYESNPKGWKKWFAWLALSSLSLGVTAASKYSYVFVGIVIILVIIIQWWKKKNFFFQGLVLWSILTPVFFFIFDPILWHSPISELTQSVTYHIYYSSNQYVKEVGYPFWQPIHWLMTSIPHHINVPIAFFNDPGNYFILADSFIFILTLIGLPSLFVKNKPMFIWLIVGLALLLLWNTKWPQYILVVLIPFCISAAYGFDLIRTHLFKGNSQ
jgi:hypothetical protein